jgi:hypothetical protein
MSRLKTTNSKKCFSILREFIADSPLIGSERERAILALEHLRKITAGTVDLDILGGSSDESAACVGRPRLDGTP